MKKYFFLFLVATVATGAMVLISCVRQENETKLPAMDATIPVKVIAIEKTTLENTVSSSGQFTTNEETLLAFKTGGIVGKVLVEEGDVVKKGQLLATLDLTEISAQVAQARLGLEKAERDYARAQNLFKDSVATLEQNQNAKTALDLAHEQMNAAQFNLQYSAIRATVDGVVLQKFVNPGQMVGPGTPVLRTNADAGGKWVLKVAVGDRQWAAIALNDSATVTTDTYRDQPLQGTVSSKSESVDPYTGSFTVQIRLLNPEKLKIASGMFGKAVIRTAVHASVWQVPYDALLDGSAGKGFVFVTNDGKTARKIPVTLGDVGKETISITEGLEGYTYLITSGSAYLTDYSPIHIDSN